MKAESTNDPDRGVSWINHVTQVVDINNPAESISVKQRFYFIFLISFDVFLVIAAILTVDRANFSLEQHILVLVV